MTKNLRIYKIAILWLVLVLFTGTLHSLWFAFPFHQEIYAFHALFILSLYFIFSWSPKSLKTEFVLALVSLKFLGYLLFLVWLSVVNTDLTKKASFLHFFISYAIVSLIFFYFIYLEIKKGEK